MSALRSAEQLTQTHTKLLIYSSWLYSSLFSSVFFSSVFELAQYCPHSSQQHRNFCFGKTELCLSAYACAEEETILERTPGEGSGFRNPLIRTSKTGPPCFDLALLFLRDGWKVPATSAVLHLRLCLCEHASVLFSESIYETDLEMCWPGDVRH